VAGKSSYLSGGGLSFFKSQVATAGFLVLRQRKPTSNKNPVKDFCWWDLGGVCLLSSLSGVQ
jgi:hypothetical protein